MESTSEAEVYWAETLRDADAIVEAAAARAGEQRAVLDATQALVGRIRRTLDSLALLQRFASHDPSDDAMTLTRAVYDAHLQALGIFSGPEAPDARARLFLDFCWIEQRALHERMRANPSRFAKRLQRDPRGTSGAAARDDNYKRLLPAFVGKKPDTPRREWYHGSLADVAVAVGRGPEFDIMQKMLSGAVHSTPMHLLLGNRKFELETARMLSAKLLFRVLGRLAAHYTVPLSDIQRSIVDMSDEDIVDGEHWDDVPPAPDAPET